MEVLLYDGTFPGFLTVLNYLLSSDEPLENFDVRNRRIDKNSEAILFLREIRTSEDLAKSLLDDLIANFGLSFREEIFVYYLCDVARLEIPLARVLKKAKGRRDFFENLLDDDVLALYRAKREFYRERHRFYGLLRFFKAPSGTLFAIFEPKYNLLPKLYPHFVKRFPREDFVILDKVRSLVFFYLNGKKDLFWAEDLKLEFDLTEDPFLELWKSYFREIAVPERISNERQRKRLPLRLRKFLPEFW